MDMKTGKPFKECIAPIMRDYDSFVECMNREPVYAKKDPKKTVREQEYGGKAGGKKGRNNPKSNPYERPPRTSSYGSDGSWKSSSWSGANKKEQWSSEPPKNEWKGGWKG